MVGDSLPVPQILQPTAESPHEDHRDRRGDRRGSSPPAGGPAHHAGRPPRALPGGAPCLRGRLRCHHHPQRHHRGQGPARCRHQPEDRGPGRGGHRQCGRGLRQLQGRDCRERPLRQHQQRRGAYPGPAAVRLPPHSGRQRQPQVRRLEAGKVHRRGAQGQDGRRHRPGQGGRPGGHAPQGLRVRGAGLRPLHQRQAGPGPGRPLDRPGRALPDLRHPDGPHPSQ